MPFDPIKLNTASRHFMSDTLTPVALYQNILKKHKETYLLESVQQNESIGQYSIIGSSPLIKLVCRERKTDVSVNGKTNRHAGNPFDLLRELTDALRFDAPTVYSEPMWIGYIGYNMIQHIERIPDDNPDEFNIPEAYLVIPSVLAVFDHIRQSLSVHCYSVDGSTNKTPALDDILSILDTPRAAPIHPLKDLPNDLNIADRFKSDTTREDYEAVVEKTKEYIRSGDIFQGVLSQQYETDYKGDSFEIYRCLRRSNPSPYMYHLAFDGFRVIGSSPEMLIKLEEDDITIRPIAGTVARGKTPAEDLALEKTLLSDEKELAEHMMLIDLARNDIGRVSVPGTVLPENLMHVENYSHVKHIVSTIKGKLNPKYDAIDLLKAVFPAGTLSGTPKIRAMEIIDELEKSRRGIYGGGIIMWRLKSFFNSCIIIRSVLLKDGTAYIRAGAGIVADSVPANEYVECERKAMAVLRAIETAKLHTETVSEK